MSIEESIDVKKAFIEDFENGLQVAQPFYVEEKTLKSSRAGKPYLDLVLRDKTGRISGKVWERAAEVSGTFSQGDFLMITGIVQDFNDSLQLRVNTAKRLERKDIDIKDFVESLDPKKAEEFFKKLLEIIDEVQNPHIKALLDSFFREPAFQEAFLNCPAAQNVHHDYIGGLLKHTLTMAVMGRFLAKKIYRDLNSDLVIAGLLLHDVGKIRELKADASISYTEEGHLLGHLVIGVKMVREKIAQIPDFPENLALLLEHMFIAHHGTPEFGSIRIPLFKEAMLVYLVDLIDSKMEIMQKSISKVKEGELWSSPCWPIENRKLLDIERFLGTGEEVPPMQEPLG